MFDFDFLDYYYPDYEAEEICSEEFLPFIVNVHSLIAKNQDQSSCLNLICINVDDIYCYQGDNKERIFNECIGNRKLKIAVRFGLVALINAGTINLEDSRIIVQWFEDLASISAGFLKHIIVRNSKYTLFTNQSDRKKRLSLVLGHINI